MAEKQVLTVELRDNPLTPDPNDYSGMVKITGTLHNAEIADRIVAERTEYRKETIENILNLADQKKSDAVGEGRSVVDGMGQYMLSISGVFTGERPAFDPKIHKFGVSYTPGKMLLEKMKNATANVVMGQVGPVVNSILDSATGKVNEVLTPGGPAVISGASILLKGEDPEVGVAFMSESGEKHKVILVVQNTKSQIIISIPALEAGQYTLSVTTQAGTGYRLLNEPRTYQFPILLTVG